MAWIIDIHQHPHPDVHEIMAQQHIKMTVLLPGPSQNDLVLEWSRKWPGMFVPFYWADLYGWEATPSSLIIDAGNTSRSSGTALALPAAAGYSASP